MLARLISRTPPLRFATSIMRLFLIASIIGGVSGFHPRTVAAQRLDGRLAADSGTVTLIDQDPMFDIDPANVHSNSGDTIDRNIYDQLISFDGTRVDRFVPQLATSWSANADQSVWTFHLRHGVAFHTGRCCLTADDVQYSIARSVLGGQSNSYIFSRFFTKPFQQIKVVDPYTVQFNLGKSQPVFLDALAAQFVGFVLDAQALKAHEKNHDYGHDWASTHDAGSGPYMVQSYQESQQAVLVRFPGYWGGWSGKHFSKAVVRIVPETATARELLERGQADLTYGLTPQDDAALAGSSRLKVVSGPTTEILFFIMTEAGPLASPYARQALSYAFNYDALINGVYRGYAQRSYGPIPRAMAPYFDPHAFHYQTDLTKARALLQKAGVKPGTTLTLAYADPTYTTASEILQAQLARIGITLNLQLMAHATFNKVFYGNEPANQRPNLFASQWWPDYNDPYDQCDILVDSKAAGPNGHNAGYYHNAQVDALLAQMPAANRDTLISLSKTLQDIVGRVDPPAIWTAEPAQVTVLARNISGFIVNPLALHTYTFYPLSRQ